MANQYFVKLAHSLYGFDQNLWLIKIYFRQCGVESFSKPDWASCNDIAT